MKIAIIGIRGVPARYGGFETAAEEISVGLVAKGHDVSVYCRYGNVAGNPPEYRGVKLIYIPHIDSKNIGTLSHSFLSFFHAIHQNYDVILAFNVGIAPLCIIPRLFGERVVLNVDGLEWKRRKWSWFARIYFKFCEYLAPKIAERIITDSKVMQKYYQDRYHALSTYIAYGAHRGKSINPEILKKYGVEKGDYFLVLSRLEPENNADLIIKAFESIKTAKKLLIIGGVSYKSDYAAKLKETKDSRILFFAPIYDKNDLKELFCNCYAYIHGNEVGGTNPALLKAMGYANCILTLNVPFNAEVVDDSTLLFDKSVEDLSNKMEFILKHSKIVADYRKKAVNRVRKLYTWDKIIDKYEGLFKEILDKT